MAYVARLLAALFVLVVIAPVRAEPPVPFEERVRILRVEMNRGPAEELAPLLTPRSDTLSRQFTIRALGRIGDRGNAPAMLGQLLGEGGSDLRLVLWAAGISRAESLADAISRHLGSSDPSVAAEAAIALGRTGREGMSERLSPLLAHANPLVRAGALEGLARLGAEGYLERVLRFVSDPHPFVRSAACFAAWLLSGARQSACRSLDRAWDGDADSCATLLPLLRESDVERRLAGLRPLGALLPREPKKTGPLVPLFALVDDPEPRVVQTLVARVLTSRVGDDVRAALVRALSHADPKVRDLAARALGGHGEQAGDALASRLSAEQDLLVRETLIVELARVGRPEFADGLAARSARPSDLAVRQHTEAQVLLLSQKPSAGRDLLAFVQQDGLHTAVKSQVIAGLGQHQESVPEDVVRALLADPDSMIRAAAVDLVTAKRMGWLLPHLDEIYDASPTFDSRDVRVAVVQAWAAAAGGMNPANAEMRQMAAHLRDRIRRAASGPWASVRAAAREAAGTLGIDGIPEAETQPANDWRGLPRPTKPVLGLDLHRSGSGEWLDEAEILRIADRIGELGPRFVFETTAGTFAVDVDPEAAPVHAASLALAVTAGVYDGTRWHRVVPNFVIQGGDPHGHGGGDAGWVVPDEVNSLYFLRGALGMPKSQKDTGGCQIFVMHTSFQPLDGGYTCYGRVVSGMDAVDRIRVGDQILSARIEAAESGGPR